MIADAAAMRREYALAYSKSLPPDESAKLKDGDSEDEYVSWWCNAYGRDMARIVRLAKTALAHLANGCSTKATRGLVHHQIVHDRSEVVAFLLDRIQPLRSVLLADPVDDQTFKRTMELIVKAFGSAE